MINKDFFAGKRILVAGGGGFVGTHLTKKLSNLGANVRSTYHSKELQEKIEGVEYVKVNLLDSGDCVKVTKDVDFVFMCAANSSGAEVMG